MSETEMRPYSAPEKAGWESVDRRELVVVDYSDEGGAVFLACKYVCKERDLLHHVFVESGDEEGDHFFEGWWREHGGAQPVPKTIAEAIGRADELSPAVILWEPYKETKLWKAFPIDAFDYLATAHVH